MHFCCLRGGGSHVTVILVVETVVADMKTGGASRAGKRAEGVHVHVSMKDETVVGH